MQERAALVKEIKNEEKKRRRRVDRARGLSDADLVSIITTRAAAKAKAKAKALAE